MIIVDYSDAVVKTAKQLKLTLRDVSVARFSLDEFCRTHKEHGDGCLGPLDASDLVALVGLGDKVSGCAFLDAALRFNLLRRVSWGILWNSGYSKRHPNARWQAQARQMRAVRREDIRRNQNRERMRRHRASKSC